MIRITNSRRRYQTSEKRFYLPGAKIEIECRLCHQDLVMDLSDVYFSYPALNEPFEVSIECKNQKCDFAETTKRIVLRVVIEEAES